MIAHLEMLVLICLAVKTFPITVWLIGSTVGVHQGLALRSKLWVEDCWYGGNADILLGFDV